MGFDNKRDKINENFLGVGVVVSSIELEKNKIKKKMHVYAPEWVR